jgi:hypothetical protein
VEHSQVEAPQPTARRSSGDDTARFLQELRQLRDGAGLGPAELAARAHYPYDRIRAAEAGPALPDLPVLSAYVRGCGGTTEEWEERWRSLTSAPTLPLLAARPAGSSTAASAGARIGSVSPAADTPDPSIILAALDRVAEGMAVAEPSVWDTAEPGAAWGTTAAASAWEASPTEAAAEPATTMFEVPAARTAEPAEPTEAGAADAGRADAALTRSADPVRTAADAAPATPVSATPVTATARPAAAGTRASAGALRKASGQVVVHGWMGPAVSRKTLVILIALVICVIIVALAIFG